MRSTARPVLPGRVLLTGAVGAAVAALGAAPVQASTAAVTASCSTPHWVAAYSLSPSDATATTPVVMTTVRSTLFPHYSGTAVRVHLSNRLGLSAVTVGTASIGTQQAGATLVPGSVKGLTFGGQPGVSIAAGAEAVSDPLPFTVTQFGELETSLFLTSAPTPPTQHILATQTGYMVPGDATLTEDGSSFVATPVAGEPLAAPQNVDLVSGLDVLTDGDVGAVAAFGDSITDGFQGDLTSVTPSPAQLDKNSRYPDDLSRRLAAAGRKLSVVDDGISGNQLLADAQTVIFGPSGLHREQADLLSQSGVTTVILLEGINDIGMSEATASALEAGDTQFVAAAHAAGLKVLLGTITPSGGAEPATEGSLAEPTRETLNAFIRAGTVGDGTVDFDAAVRDPANPTQLLPAYDGSDHLHFTALGYQAMADAVPLDEVADVVCGQAAPAAPAAAPEAPPTSTAPAGANRLLAATGGLPDASVAGVLLVVGGTLHRRRRRGPRKA